MKSWTVTVSSKGQVTMPKEMREELHLRPGDQLICSIIDGQVIVTPKNVDFNDLAGLLGRPPNGSFTLEEIDEAVLRAAGSNALYVSDDESPDAAA